MSERMTATKVLASWGILNLRPSACDRAWNCAESLFPEVAVDPVGEAAEMGSSFHEVMRARINQTDHSVDEIAERYGADLEELERLIAYAGVAERDLKTWFTDDAAEVRLEHEEPWEIEPYRRILLSGTVDRLSVPTPERASVLDWKTGMAEGYAHQQRAYAFLTLRRYPTVTEVYSATVYVRLGYWHGRLYRASDLEDWWADMKRHLVNGLGKFSPGSHCGYCPRRAECPGVRQYTESCLATIDSNPTTQAELLTADNAAELGPHLADTLRRVRYIEGRCKEFRDTLRDQVRTAGGEVPAGDGMVLRIVETRRRELDALKAWPVLTGRLTDEQIAGACKLSISKCQTAASESAPIGTKGTVRKQIEAELEEAGAITTKISEQLREVQE